MSSIPATEYLGFGSTAVDDAEAVAMAALKAQGVTLAAGWSDAGQESRAVVKSLTQYILARGSALLTDQLTVQATELAKLLATTPASTRRIGRLYPSNE